MYKVGDKIKCKRDYYVNDYMDLFECVIPIFKKGEIYTITNYQQKWIFVDEDVYKKELIEVDDRLVEVGVFYSKKEIRKLKLKNKK